MTESDVEAVREKADEAGFRGGIQMVLAHRDSTDGPLAECDHCRDYLHLMEESHNAWRDEALGLLADRERLMGALHRDDDSEDGAGLIPAVDWMLDILEMYEDRLKDFGDPPELVHSYVNEAAKAKARRDLRAARDLLDEMEGGDDD